MFRIIYSNICFRCLGPSAFYKWYLFEIYIYLFVRHILIFIFEEKCEQIIVRQISKNALMFEEEKKLLEHEKSEPSDI
jgi:hypothetical protein